MGLSPFVVLRNLLCSSSCLVMAEYSRQLMLITFSKFWINLWTTGKICSKNKWETTLTLVVCRLKSVGMKIHPIPYYLDTQPLWKEACYRKRRPKPICIELELLDIKLNESCYGVSALSSMIFCSKRPSKAQVFFQEKNAVSVLLSTSVKHFKKGDLNSRQVLFPDGYAASLTSVCQQYELPDFQFY